MLTSATIENFRGIQRLSVEGLGRVTLIIGKNDSGKTALMEALWVAVTSRGAGLALAQLQSARIAGSEKVDNFDEFWRPIFRSGNAERGLTIQTQNADGGRKHLTLRKSADQHAKGQTVPVTVFSHELSPAALPWALECELKKGDQPAEHFQILSRPEGMIFPQTDQPTAQGAAWVTTGTPDLSQAIRELSKLKQQGQDGVIRDLMKHVDELIEGVEILSPTGGQASVFVRVLGEPSLLPLRVMGEGVQRCFEMAVVLSSARTTMLAIDEIENGLHHSVLKPIWKWLAEVSARRGIQVFATTHSEECVLEACHAFKELGDDGLRVIRLDRRETETVANVYDRNLIEAAERLGTELRG